ncbi:MAG: 50S ribosomal protein L28 [Oscillospiraceae bacterium]|nr:50S ribosomal protein L28 [Oscillospiraceae bacterium]
MAKCSVCDKATIFGNARSHSMRRTNRSWKPNVKRVKAVVNGAPKHIHVCTRCLRSGRVTRAV